MKQHAFAVAIAAAAFLPASASAQIGFSGAYVGIDYQYMNLSYEDFVVPTTPPSTMNGDTLFEDSLHGINAHIGSRYGQNLGFEAGFIWVPEGEKSNLGITTKIDLL